MHSKSHQKSTKHSRSLQIIGVVLSIIIALLYIPSVYLANSLAYKTRQDIKYEVIEHPELLFPSEYTRIFSFGAKESMADFLWISLIQYIGSNVIEAEYKKYMAKMVDIITDLSPKFSYPVEVSLILLPEANKLYENYSEQDVARHRENAIKLGKKIMAQTCSKTKIQAIEKTSLLSDIVGNKNLENPCSNGMIPYYLGYIYYFLENNPGQSAYYYKIASAQHDDTPEFARTMYAIMSGKSGDREKSAYLFLSLALGDTPSSDCSQAVNQIKTLLSQYSFTELTKSPEYLKALNTTFQSIAKVTLEKQGKASTEENITSNTCLSSLGKVVREHNLAYIEEGDNGYVSRYGKSAKNAKTLRDAGYISYLPLDFQRNGNDNFEVIYFYNDKTKSWDYRRGTYE